MGNQPPREIAPAPYALPPGTPALQSHPWGRRVLLVVAATLAGVGGTAGYTLGRSRAAVRPPVLETPDRPAPLDLEEARTLASGPLQDLLSQYRPYLELIADASRDEALWSGVDRMLRSVLADADHEDADLVAALHGTLTRLTPPPGIDRLLPMLELRMREVERQRRR